jgi:hypothetical protein
MNKSLRANIPLIPDDQLEYISCAEGNNVQRFLVYAGDRNSVSFILQNLSLSSLFEHSTWHEGSRYGSSSLNECRDGPMMQVVAALGLVGLSLTACTTWEPIQPVAELPPGVYGTYEDNAVGAVNQSSWALASPQRTMNNPLEAINAVIAVDWLADELEVNPRWIAISPLTKQHMRQVRIDVRRVLGINANAPSGYVVGPLLSTAWNLELGARPSDIGALKDPPFT